MNLVPMKLEHIDEMAQLERECFSCPWSREMIVSELENRYARYTIAEEDGHVVGYVGVYAVAGQGFISNIAVSPGARRRGVASALLRELIEYGRNSGMEELMLEVRRSNTGAIALYEKFGFVRAGLRPRYYDRPVEDAVLMNLRLTGENK